MLESINLDSSVAIYVQIENQVQFAIASGKLKAGHRLPTVLELSKRLDVNPNTVTKAYRDLEVMGLVYTRRGVGVFVNKGVEAKCRADCRKRIADRVHEAVAEAKAAGLTKSEVVKVVGKSFAANAVLYGPVPLSVLALAKLRKPSG